MSKKAPEQKNISASKRPPVIAIMGHIDHGKSTLLDYIRKTNITLKEAGGITQHLGAYEVTHKGEEGESTITFLDTPGHEAFSGIRSRGANVADIAILVVSGEEGVKPQTVEALKSIIEANIPYIVAINKIDSPKADLERTKQSLAEHEIYIEGYGGQIPWVGISGKTGEGVPELLDMVLLLADLASLTGDHEALASGVVIEAHLDTKQGLTAVVLVKNGTIRKGQQIVCGQSSAPVRNIENFLGEKIDSATFSSPVKVIGWDKIPKVGDAFMCFEDKKEALEYMLAKKPAPAKLAPLKPEDKSKTAIHLVVKADMAGSLEAVLNEIKKIKNERALLVVVHSDVGEVSLNDVKKAADLAHSFVIGFNTKIDAQAKSFTEKTGIEIHVESIIYKLIDWLKAKIEETIPKVNVEETQGKAKILKVFSRSKDKQIVGGRVEFGSIFPGEDVKILRRDAEIGKGRIKELQQQKAKSTEAIKDTEFGAEIQCTIEIAPGDRIEGFKMVEK